MSTGEFVFKAVYAGVFTAIFCGISAAFGHSATFVEIVILYTVLGNSFDLVDIRSGKADDCSLIEREPDSSRQVRNPSELERISNQLERIEFRMMTPSEREEWEEKQKNRKMLEDAGVPL